MSMTSRLERDREYITRLRRHFHQHPELSKAEKHTSAKVCEELAAMGIPFVMIGEYGVMATIEGTRTDRVVALRADMDALPIQEESELPFASQNPGVMHACGHDGHTAALLGAAKLLHEQRGELHGTVKLCFQQAEEAGYGAKEMLAELKKFPVRSTFGIHLWAEIESGRISVQPGFRMAASQAVQITVKGSGCHGAYPSKGVDPIITSAAIMMNLAAMLTRENNPFTPAVLTFGKIVGGDMGNIIPETAMMQGTLRSTGREQEARLMAAVERVARLTAETYRATAEVTWYGNVPVVSNDPHCSAVAAKAAAEVAGKAALMPFEGLMASENYGEYLETYPGVFAFVGVRNEAIGATYPHHHPKFAMDEAALPLAAGLYAQYALDFFNAGE